MYVQYSNSTPCCISRYVAFNMNHTDSQTMISNTIHIALETKVHLPIHGDKSVHVYSGIVCDLVIASNVKDTVLKILISKKFGIIECI